jgi:hypothetical protein
LYICKSISVFFLNILVDRTIFLTFTYTAAHYRYIIHTEIYAEHNSQPPSFTAFGNSTPRSEQPVIRTPDQVKDILNRIHNLQPTNIKQSNTETQDETSSNNDRIISESTLSESNPNKKKYARKPKKSGISII